MFGYSTSKAIDSLSFQSTLILLPITLGRVPLRFSEGGSTRATLSNCWLEECAVERGKNERAPYPPPPPHIVGHGGNARTVLRGSGINDAGSASPGIDGSIDPSLPTEALLRKFLRAFNALESPHCKIPTSERATSFCLSCSSVFLPCLPSQLISAHPQLTFPPTRNN